MKKVVITGGTGYIGSHTAIDLIQNGFEVIILDGLSRSSIDVLDRIEKITNTRPKFYQVDLKNESEISNVFSKEAPIDGIIHFAAYKYVNESVEKPLLYYQNNIQGLLNLLQEVKNFEIPNFVFSSSCSVYGQIDQLPVSESTKLNPPQSPYANTKVMGEEIIKDVSHQLHTKFISLRYFNPVGAHDSGEIGESPLVEPNNLVPRITGVAIGKYPVLKVYGHTLDTRDGSCIRDYIHIMDIAEAHTLAYKKLESINTFPFYEVLNLGSGQGVTVLELIDAFEQVSNVKLPVELTDPRPGDVVAVFSDNNYVKEVLKWTPKRSIKDMMSSAWAWQKKLAEI